MIRILDVRMLCAAIMFLSVVGIAHSQQPPSGQPAKEISADEEQIRQGVVSFVEQYNAHKPEEVAALFAGDARMVFRDGTEVNGRDEIKKSFDEAFRESPKASISIVVDSIRFLTSDVAVEEGTTNIFPDGETLTQAGRYTVLHLKRDGRWRMQSVRVVEEETLSAFGQLQPLEWLIGDWLDEGRDETVETKFHWDDNKSFLIEEFHVIQEGEIVLKGTQRIGWDPQAKQIRSWVFDNAGGFGEAVWSADGNDWICKTKGVTPEGDSASATRTLVRAGEDIVYWVSTQRIMAGDRLPDLAVTMVRKAPQPENPN